MTPPSLFGQMTLIQHFFFGSLPYYLSIVWLWYSIKSPITRWDNEHIPYNMAFDNTTFNQMIFAAEETTATTTTYANTQWKGKTIKK